MKRTLIPVILLIVGCILSGCVVRSVYPWLPNDTKVTDVNLSGTWYDGNKNVTAFFTSGSETNYNVLFVNNKQDQSRITASLHRLEKTLLLVVGPEDTETRADKNFMSVLTTIPAYLLFKVDLNDNIMKLYDLNLESFDQQIKKQKLNQLGEGDKKEGFIIINSTEELAAFLKNQLKDKTLFDEAPLYTLKKLEK